MLGPLEVRHDGVPCASPELRRGRVRQLLALLVLERSITRDRAEALLWPDLPAEAAAKNLRVTLTHLRKVLEPGRPAGTPGYHVRVDQTSLGLHPSAHLRVDAWEADEWAQRLERTHELTAERDALTRLVGLWRGLPYPDLDDLVDLTGTLERVRNRHVGTLLRLGELHIASGAAEEAKRLALEMLEVDPYREQAHRLAIAADLRLDDAAELRRSVARLSQAMDELGVEASASTQVLLHRVSLRAGDRPSAR
ncbi:MAG: BTAD domain-containing putative transcriptional regulator [Acidimicrobiales bacterium]